MATIAAISVYVSRGFDKLQPLPITTHQNNFRDTSFLHLHLSMGHFSIDRL